MLLLLKTDIEFKWFYFLLFRVGSGEFSAPAWLVISFWFLRDLVSAFASAAASPLHRGGVGFGAHVGGTLFGLGLIALEKLRIQVPITSPVSAAPVVTTSQPAAIYLYLNDAQAGPFTPGQVRNMLSTGSIPQDTLYWKEGLENWRPTQELR